VTTRSAVSVRAPVRAISRNREANTAPHACGVRHPPQARRTVARVLRVTIRDVGWRASAARGVRGQEASRPRRGDRRRAVKAQSCAHGHHETVSPDGRPFFRPRRANAAQAHPRLPDHTGAQAAYQHRLGLHCRRGGVARCNAPGLLAQLAPTSTNRAHPLRDRGATSNPSEPRTSLWSFTAALLLSGAPMGGSVTSALAAATPTKPGMYSNTNEADGDRPTPYKPCGTNLVVATNLVSVAER
jgi:hypothetical protein